MLHLPQTVREFGPLFVTSCFPYENANGILKSLVTGTKYSQFQICAGVSLFSCLPEMRRKIRPQS